MRKEELDSLCEQLQEAGWEGGAFRSVEKIAGGIHDAHCMRFANGRLFLKTTRLESAAMLDDEADALERLRASGSVLLPKPLLNGVAGEIAYLALKWIDLYPATSDAQRRLGYMLANMHRFEADRHGWHRSNHIGTMRQINDWCDDWCEFFATRRLEFQLRLAERRGGNRDWIREGFGLMDRLPNLLDGYQPVPSLLHGDLWNGNMAMRFDGEPVIFDPAAWHGDRETDLAMTELFGGFSADFYSAYAEEWPLEPGYAERKPLYQLYHVINHYNMFGGGYERQAASLIKQLLARCQE